VPGHEGIVGIEPADQLARTGSEDPFTGPEPACGISVADQGVDEQKSHIQKKWEIRYRPQIGKGTYTRAHYQKNEGCVEIKQRPIKMGSRAIYITLI
jgi:hypothetical protein